jgi:hypothetical protein
MITHSYRGKAAETPPSTAITAPVVLDDSLPKRYETVAATSSLLTSAFKRFLDA